MWSSWPCVRTIASMSSSRSLMYSKSGQDQVDAGLVVLGEQDAAVDDEQTAGVLEDGHVAADLAEPTECDDAQGAVGQCRRQGELGVRVTHVSPGGISAPTTSSSPAARRPSRISASSSSVAGTSGRRTERSGRTPSTWSAAFAATAWKPAPLSASIAGMIDRKMRSAAAWSPASNARDDRRRAGGRRRGPTTLTMPTAPCASRREQGAVVAGVPGQAGRGDRLGGGVRVAAGVLHGDDAVVARERVDGRRREPDAGAARDVVEHDGQVGGVGDGLDVPADALLRRARVVRADDEQAVRTGLGGLLGHADGVRGVVGPGAGDDPRAGRRRPRRRPRTSSAFSGACVVGRLAGGAVEHEPVVAVVARGAAPAGRRRRGRPRRPPSSA